METETKPAEMLTAEEIRMSLKSLGVDELIEKEVMGQARNEIDNMRKRHAIIELEGRGLTPTQRGILFNQLRNLLKFDMADKDTAFVAVWAYSICCPKSASLDEINRIEGILLEISKNHLDADIRRTAKEISDKVKSEHPPALKRPWYLRLLDRIATKTVATAAITSILGALALAPKADAQVGNYPNFTDAGTHGNPAVFTQYGNWALVGASGGWKGVDGMSVQVSTDYRGVQLNAIAGTNGTKKTQMLNAGMMFGENVAAGVTIKPDGNASFGMLGIARQDSGKTLERVSFETDVKAHSSAAAAEVRRMIRDKIEATVSGKVEVDSSGNIVAGGVGMQVKKGIVMVSCGVGGKGSAKEAWAGGKDDWKDIKLHARIWRPDKKNWVDFQLKAPNGNFKKPAITIGLQKMLN